MRSARGTGVPVVGVKPDTATTRHGQRPAAPDGKQVDSRCRCRPAPSGTCRPVSSACPRKTRCQRGPAVQRRQRTGRRRCCTRRSATPSPPTDTPLLARNRQGQRCHVKADAVFLPSGASAPAVEMLNPDTVLLPALATNAMFGVVDACCRRRTRGAVQKLAAVAGGGRLCQECAAAHHRRKQQVPKRDTAIQRSGLRKGLMGIGRTATVTVWQHQAI